MIETLSYDVAIIGGGAAGLFAAKETASAGCSTLVIDREKRTGGILNQCIHPGFGLHCFKKELTGPEFAAEADLLAKYAGADFRLDTTVREIKRQADGTFQLDLASGEHGISTLHAKTVILTAGCRERNRGNLAIPGKRPAGVWTAGSAQKLMNINGMLPGKRAVIVGSGDIGLIMARRLTWSGVKVLAVIEILPHPSGLIRNIAQCLEDFNIPLYLSHSVVDIRGSEHVSGISAAPLVNGVPDMENQIHFDCDTVLFSVGLIPSNELIVPLGAAIDPATNGAIVDSNGETTVPGLFSAGNVRHVHDLVDFVAEEAAETGRAVVRKLKGTMPPPTYQAHKNAALRYVIPSKFAAGETTHFRFRPVISAERCELTAISNGEVIQRWTEHFVNPAEMIQVQLETPAADVTFELNEVKK